MRNLALPCLQKLRMIKFYREQVMALRGRCGKLDVKKSSYYVWYLGAREAKGVQAMPDAIDYLLERERLQEPFKVTLQVSSKGLKIIQTVHPGGSTRQAVKHLVPGHALLAAVQREDVVAATLLLPNPASNNPVHVHAYRCDSVETAELLGGQLKILASHSAESLAARLGVPGNNNGILGSNGINGCTNTATATATTTTTTTNGGSGSLDSRLQRGSAGNLGSDGRSTRESESSEGSGEHQTNRHLPPIQSTTIYESLAAELRAKLGRGNAAADCDAGPILLPPRDYDTMHRARGNLAGIELRRCLNQTIVGPNTTTTTTTTAATTNNNKNAAGQTTQTQTQTPVITADSNRPTLATMNTGGTGGTRSAASSGIGSDSAATPPPYQHHPHHNHHNNHHGNHHLQHHGGSSGALCPRPTRPTRDSSSDDDWGHGIEDTDYLSNHHHHHHHHEISPSATLQHQHHQHAAVKQSVSLPRLPRSPERGNHAMIPTMKAHHLHNNHHNLQHHHHHHHHRGSPGGPAVILSNGTQLPPGSHHQGGGRLRRSLAEHRQRSPSPQYQPRHPAPSDVVSPRERFHDAKEMFRQMEREAIGTSGRNGAAGGVTATPPPPPTTTTATRVNGRNESRTLHRSEPVTRQLSHEEPLQAHPQQHQILQRQPPSRQQQFVHHHQHQSPLTQQHQLHQTPPTPGQQQLHERLIRRGAMPHHHVPPPESPIEPPLQPEISADFRPRARPQRYGAVPAMIQEREPQQEQQQSTSELSRPRPRSFYEVPMAARELRGPRNPIEAREYARGLSSLQNNNNNNNNSNGKQIPPPQPQHPAPQRPRPFTYGELSENERYPGLDRDSARSSMLDSMNSKAQVSTPARYRHSYAEPPRLGLAALHPY